MKTLSYYKSQYRQRKTSKGKGKVMNKAILNLSYEDQQRFIKWQVEQMNKE